MGKRKLNMFSWSVGLAAALSVLCLIGAVGDSYARYQVNQSESIFYTADQSSQICLGQMVTQEDGTITFDSQAVGSWEKADGKSVLTFTVANGTSEESFDSKDQRVQLRLAGSLGVWDGLQTVSVTLCVPNQDSSDENQPQYDEIPGRAQRITPETPLYNVFGDGWLFTFMDENEEEWTWLLEGEKFSAIQMRLVIEGVELTDPSLLQLTATGHYVPEEP